MHRTRSLHASHAAVFFVCGIVCAGNASYGADPGLPLAPEGTRLRSLTTFAPEEQEPVRIAAHPESGRLFVLGGGGDVTAIDPVSGKKKRVLVGADYIEQPKRPQVNIPLPIDARWVNSPITLRATLCLGLAFDRDARLYVVANVQTPGKILVNRVLIYRTAPVNGAGEMSRPELWTRFDYPYGVGGFNHGACRIAQGPDGKIYLGSGSRTDHGETGDQSNISHAGEGPHPDVPAAPGVAGGDFTAAILRFAPDRNQQVPEVYSRGNRNPFGFDFYRTGALPKRYECSFFLTRFGNLVNYNRIGFDVLNIRLEEKDGELVAHTERFLDRLGRPIDVCISGGKLYVVEYCRQTETAGPGSEGWGTGGRVLEVAGKP